MDLVIRPLTLAEVEILIDWAALEGWNPGWRDAEAFYAADPEGFLGGFLGDDLITGISAVRYGADFGFIGLYITRPDHRSRGYGRAIWNAGMHLLEGRTIGLDGVPQQQRNYQSKGFQPSYGTTRYSGPFDQADPQAADIRKVELAILPKLLEFDRQYFPGDREQFLNEWIRVAHSALVHIEDGEIQGYGVARACRDGYKIGPLFATSPQTAALLVTALGESCDGDMHIDVPHYQAQFIENLISIGLVPGFSTARMYHGISPMIAAEGVFAVTSLELG